MSIQRVSITNTEDFLGTEFSTEITFTHNFHPCKYVRHFDSKAAQKEFNEKIKNSDAMNDLLNAYVKGNEFPF